MIENINDIARMSLDEESAKNRESLVLKSDFVVMTTKEYLLTVIDLFGTSYGVWIFCYISWIAQIGFVNMLLLVAVSLFVHHFACRSLVFLSDQFGFVYFIEVGNLFQNRFFRFVFRLAFVSLNAYGLLASMMDINRYGCEMAKNVGIRSQFLTEPSSLIWLILSSMAILPFLITRNVKNNYPVTIIVILSAFFFMFLIIFSSTTGLDAITDQVVLADKELLWWSSKNIPSIYANILYSFAVQANLMDIYAQIPHRSPSKISKCLNTQVALSTFIYLVIGLLGYFAFYNYTTIESEVSLLQMMTKKPILKFLSELFILVISLNNLIYYFRPMKDSILIILRDLQASQPVRNDVQIEDHTKDQDSPSLTPFLLLGVITVIAGVLIMNGIEVEKNCEFVMILTLPLLYIVIPIFVHMSFLQSKRLVLVVLLSFGMWCWAIGDIIYQEHL
jgi:hypothetical protein